MNIGSLLIRFALDTIWVWAFGFAILLLLRMVRRKPLFTEKDWLALCGHTRAEVFSSRLLLRFFGLLLVVIATGLGIGHWLAPHGAGCRVGIRCASADRYWGRAPDAVVDALGRCTLLRQCCLVTTTQSRVYTSTVSTTGTWDQNCLRVSLISFCTLAPVIVRSCINDCAKTSTNRQLIGVLNNASVRAQSHSR
jgi:hypothetical protein